MYICNKCGEENDDGVRFCLLCGEALPEKISVFFCRFCEKEIDDKSLFCKYCGHSQIDEEKKDPSLPGDFVISSESSLPGKSNIGEGSYEGKRIRRIPQAQLGLKKSVLTENSKEDFPYSIKLLFEDKKVDKDTLFKDNLCMDVGPGFVKLFQPGLDKNHCIYPEFMFFQRPPQKAFKKEFFFSPATVAKVVKDNLREHNLNLKTLSLVIPSYASTVRTLILPHMNERKLASVIKEQVFPFLPFSSKKAEMEAYIADSSLPDEEGFMKVRFLATDKSYINKAVELAEQMNLKLETLITGYRAFFNTLYFSERNEMESLAVIDFGFYSTNITIIKDGNVVQTAYTEKGLTDLIMAIARAKNISFLKAQTILEDTEIDITWADSKNAKLFEILISSLKDWMTEVTKSFNSFGMEYKLNKKNYSRLILSGEGGCIGKMNKFIGNQLGMKCDKFLLPVSKLVKKYDHKKIKRESPLFMASLGISLARFYEDKEPGKKINLKTGLFSAIFGQ